MTPGTPLSSDPARRFFAITPHDSNDLERNTRYLVIHTAGAIKVNDDGGNAVTMTVPAGVLPIVVSRVWSTGTTATGISGLV